MKPYSKLRCIAIILLAAGYGWAGGHYIPADSNLLAYLFQFIVLAILVWLSCNYFTIGNDKRPPLWVVRGLTIFSSISFLINILNVIHGALNHDVHSFGSHNTFADLVPIAFLIGGSGLWIFTILPSKRNFIH